MLKDGLDDDVFTWDTTTVPDGTYVIKVTASDGAANAASLALQGERESQSFEIDNTPPAVTVAPTGAGAAPGTIRFTVQDTQTAIQRVEYASAGDRWRQAYPMDGLLDSREERFELVLGAGAKSPSWCARRTARQRRDGDTALAQAAPSARAWDRLASGQIFPVDLPRTVVCSNSQIRLTATGEPWRCAGRKRRRHRAHHRRSSSSSSAGRNDAWATTPSCVSTPVTASAVGCGVADSGSPRGRRHDRRRPAAAPCARRG